MLGRAKKKIRSLTVSAKQRFEEYLEKQRFYPIDYSIETDVFVAGFPKSGNTWMQNLLASVIFGISPSFLPDTLVQELVPDVHVKKYYKRFLPLTCFKTHRLPKPRYKKVIHLIRDGRDAMVSYYAMQKALGKKITLSEMIKENKSLRFGSWGDHTKAWQDNPYNADIMLLRYEDLLDNSEEQLKRICSFIGIERPSKIIELSATDNSFKEMQKREKDYGNDNKMWKSSEKFVRKGGSGNYREEMPAELIDYFTEHNRRELEFYDYEV